MPGFNFYHRWVIVESLDAIQHLGAQRLRVLGLLGLRRPFLRLRLASGAFFSIFSIKVRFYGFAQYLLFLESAKHGRLPDAINQCLVVAAENSLRTSGADYQPLQAVPRLNQINGHTGR